MPFTRTLLPLLFVCSIVLPALAQYNGQASIQGRVVDASTGEPLGFANVSVLEEGSEELRSGGITDIDGVFDIAVPPGSYKVKVDFLSFETRIVSGVKISEPGSAEQIGEIALNPDAHVMEEVEVVAEKSQLQIGLDKRVFNVGKDLSSTGGSAADLLDNIPSVVVDGEGNVSLRGSQGVKILINGRPSGLVGIGDNNGLQLLQSNMIDRVEIITNPSAKYQAEGSAGNINIILKKEKDEGVNGSFDLNAGFPYSLGAAANVNLRKRFFNLFGNFGVNYRERLGGGSTSQQFIREDTTFFTDIERDRTRTGKGFNTQVGADFYLNPSNVLTTSFLYRRGNDDNLNETIYRDYDEDRILTEITSRTDNELEEEYTLEYNLNYRKEFDRDGQQLTFDIQYQDNSETEKSSIVERLVDENLESVGEDPLLQRSLNDERERSLLLQGDYVQPLGKEGKLEAGYQSSLRNIDNDYSVEEQNESGDWEELPAFSNVFDYDENIHAAYVTAGN